MKTVKIPIRLFKIFGIIIISGIVLFLTVCIIKEVIKREAVQEIKKAKIEVVEKVKTVENFNDSAAAEVLATTIHKFSSFKDKVKNKLDSLNKIDSLKKDK